MPNNVDTRIVEMEFDNAQFERGAKQTLKTLDALNKNLEFSNATKGLDSLQNGINNLKLDKLLSSVQNAEYSLTTVFGNIKRSLYETFAQDIVNTVQFGVQKVYNATFGQIKSGGASRAMNLARSQFKLEGLGIAWEKISDSIDQAVSGTAYGMDAAATVASQFAASGLELGDTMTRALKAVSGVAAMTGSSFEDIGQIFNTVSGQGRLMADQLNQLSVRGINAAATLAKALNKTEAEVRAMTSKGQISFEMFYEAMYDAYAEHAFAANDTYEGALSNVKAALSRIGEIFYTPFYNSAIKPLNKLREIISNFVKALKNSEKTVRSFAQVIERLVGHLAGIANIILNQLAKVMTTFEEKTLPGIVEKLDKMTDKVHDLRVLLRGHFKGENWLNTIQNKKLKGALTDITSAELQAAKDIWLLGKYGTGQERIEALEKAGLRAKVVQKYIDDFIAVGYEWEEVSQETANSTAKFSDTFIAMAKIFGSVQLVVKDIKGAFTILKNTVVNDLIPVVLDAFSSFADAMDKTFRRKAKQGFGFSKLAKEIETLVKAFADMYWRMDSGKSILATVMGAVKVLFTVFNFGQRVAMRFIRFLTSNVDAIYWIADAIRTLGSIISEVLKAALKAFLDVFQLDGSDWFVTLTKGIAMFLRKIEEWLKSSGGLVRIFKVIFTAVKAVIVVLKALATGLGNVLNPFEEGTGGTQKPLYSLLDGLVLLIDKFIEFVTESRVIEKAMEGVGKGFKAFGDFIKGLTGNSVLQNILSFFDGMTKAVKSGKLKKGFEDIISTVLGGIDKVWGAITGTNYGDGDELGPLMTRFTDLQNGVSDGSVTAETFGETLSKAIGDARKSVEDDLDKIQTFFESLSKTIHDTKRDVEDIAQYLGGGLATALVWVGKWVMTESDLKGLEETDNVLGKIWRWLEDVAELEEQKGPKTLGVGNLIDKVTELYDGLKALLPTIKDVAEITMIFNTGVGIKNFGEGIKVFASGITGIGSGFKALAKSVGKASKIWARAQKTLANATFLTSFAALLLVIFAGIAVLTSIIENSTDGYKSLKTALILMAGIIVVVVGIVAVLLHFLNKALKENDKFPDVMAAFSKLMLSIAVTVLIFAGSVALLALVINKFGGKHGGVIVASCIILAAMLGAIFGIIAYLLKFMYTYNYLLSDTYNTAEFLEKMAQVIKSLGSAILLMAVSFGIIAFIVSKIGNTGELVTAISVLLGMIGSLVLVVYLLTKLEKIGDMGYALQSAAKMFTSIGIAVVAMAIAFGLIAGVVKEHKDNPEIIRIAGVMLLAMMAIIAITAWILSKLPADQAKNFDNASKLFFSMTLLIIGLAVSFGIMAEVLRRAEENNVNIGWLMAAFGILLALVALVGFIAAKGGALAGGKMALIALAIVVLAGALVVFAQALRVLDDVNSDGLAKVLKTLGKASLWMIGAGIGMMFLGTGALVLAVGVAALAGALFLLGLVLTPLMPLISWFVDTFKDASEGVEESSEKVTGSLGGSMGDKLGKAFRDFIKSIKKYAPEIIEDIKDIMSMVVEAFFAPLSGVGKGLITVLSTSLYYMNEHIDEVLGPLGELIDKFLIWLEAYAPKIAYTIGLLLFWVFNGGLVILSDYAAILAANLFEAFASILEAFADQLSEENNDRIANAITDICDGIWDLFKKTLWNLQSSQMADDISDWIANIFTSMKKAINKWSNEKFGFDVFDMIDDEEGEMPEWMDYDEKTGQWVYNAEEYEKLKKAQEEQRKEARRIQKLKDDKKKENKDYVDAQKAAFLEDNKEAEDNAEESGKEVGKKAAKGYKEGLEEETKKGSTVDILGNITKSLEGTGTSVTDLIKAHLGGMSSEDIISSFGLGDLGINADDLNSMFSSVMSNGSTFDATAVVSDVQYGENGEYADLQSMMNDYSDMDFAMADGSTDISQTTSGQVNAELSDETKDLLKNVKSTLADLTDMLDNVTIVSNDSKVSTTLDVDGETLGSVVMPFVDAAFAGGGKKAKTKTAQTYKNKKRK